MHEIPLLKDLAVILIASGFVSLLFKKLKQPVVVGYILAGFLIGPNFQSFFTMDLDNIHLWAEIGIIFILFSLGLEFSFKKLFKTGLSSGTASAVEITIMFFIGYTIASLLGWSTMHKIFMGGMLAISSTAIIYRTFSDKNLQGRSFTNFVFGILIFEDLVAILLLVLLPAFAASNAFSGTELMVHLTKMGFFLVLWFVAGIFLLPSLFRKIKSRADDELYVILSLGLCFALVTISLYLGYSTALGAFVMGSLLAETEAKDKIMRVFAPIRSLFAAIFFVSVGMLVVPSVVIDKAGVILVLSVLVLFGKTFGVFLGSLVAGQAISNSVLTATSMAQIGEFSFILAKLGISRNIINEEVFPIIVSVSLITTFITPYWLNLGLKLSLNSEEKIPKRIKNILLKYDDFIHYLSFQRRWIQAIKNLILNFVIFSVIILSLFITFNFLSKNFDFPTYIYLLSAVLASSPFIWAMLFKEIPFLPQNRFVFTTRSVYTFFFILLLSNIFFIQLEGLMLVLMVIAFSLLWFYSKPISEYYGWYEKQFISNYQGPKKKTEQLAPWDIHISKFRIKPFSRVSGKSIGELKVREKYNITIASIERGESKIFAPSYKDLLFPYDKISLIGEDDAIQSFKDEQLSEDIVVDNNEDQKLEKFAVDEPLDGIIIREAKIREDKNAIIVGIERGNERILNPSPNIKLKLGDLIWLLSQNRKT